jgi:CheY-like chemotaxis protein
MIALLIVDDEFALVETLKDYLEDAGYRVATASDGREGLDAMNEHVPDLVVTDLMMPLMNGREMIAAMRGEPRFASVPVILMSAARRQIAAPPGDDFPTFSVFLRKPFLLRALMDEIVRLVGRGYEPKAG